MSAVEAELPDHNTALVLVFFLVVPLLLLSFVAMLTGIVLTFFNWKQWPLVLLSGMSILISSALATKFGSTIVIYKFVTVLYALTVAYGFVVLAITGVWFFALRQKHVSTTES